MGFQSTILLVPIQLESLIAGRKVELQIILRILNLEEYFDRVSKPVDEVIKIGGCIVEMVVLDDYIGPKRALADPEFDAGRFP